jgi:hypothetical protein
MDHSEITLVLVAESIDVIVVISDGMPFCINCFENNGRQRYHVISHYNLTKQELDELAHQYKITEPLDRKKKNISQSKLMVGRLKCTCK